MPIFTNLLLDKLSATLIRKHSYIEGDGQVQVPALTEAAGTEVGQVASHLIVVFCTQLLRRIRKERKETYASSPRQRTLLTKHGHLV